MEKPRILKVTWGFFYTREALDSNRTWFLDTIAIGEYWNIEVLILGYPRMNPPSFMLKSLEKLKNA